ncbi:hypothetical protein H1P_110024 [Hyella patelloides LEGE 07179]|uniref:Uncharacterized protein n=1 Tax=Hyella patelloides LEGE 07179 TaxID=945734 RepID=A0A563VJF9_9CYAN|nr:hypothetical protein H1P_110024 [Hyella patelloides LEGE 07179]
MRSRDFLRDFYHRIFSSNQHCFFEGDRKNYYLVEFIVIPNRKHKLLSTTFQPSSFYRVLSTMTKIEV